MTAIFVVVIGGVLGFGTQAQAADYYVSPITASTNWTAAQNIDTPCTVQTAMDSAVAGDTVYFRGGIYNPGNAPAWSQNALQPFNSGTSENPIIFKAYPNEIPFIVANQGFDGGAFGVNNKDWIVWDGFHSKAEQIANGIRKIMYIRDADHVTIRNCDLEGNSLNTDGQNNSIISIYGPNYLTVENCNLYGAGGLPGSSHNSAALLIYHSCHMIICNCDIHDNHTGIFEKENNYLNNTYYNNFIYNNHNGLDYSILFVDWKNYTCKNNVFYNNSHVHIEVNGGTQDGTLDNLRIYNNTFINPAMTGTAFALEDRGTIRNIEVYNNIVGNANRVYRHYANEIFYADYNNFYDCGYFWIDWVTGDFTWWKAQTVWDNYSITGNPNFINPGGTNPEDYKLQSSSPTLTLGIDRQDYDNDGNTTERIPAGAYITGDEIIGYTDSGTPDTTPPSRSNPQPTGILSSGTTSTIISLYTDETATCKYSEIAGTAYDSITNTFTTTGGTTHSQTITGLSDGNTYTYYIRCQDTATPLNQNTNDFTISFSVANAASDITPPLRTNAFPQGEIDAGTTAQDISLSTDENATCKYAATQGTSYANMTQFINTTGTNHLTEVSGLENGQIYTYYVKCKDSSDNINNDDFLITFSVADTQTVYNTSSGGKSCFIATAAYGTPLAEEVKVLSKFREQHLLTNYCGQTFVKLYYKYSPKMANYIRHRDRVRSVVRLMLSPLVNLTK